MQGHLRWGLYVLVGATLTGAYVLLPAGLVRDSDYQILSVSCALAIAFGIKANRPVSRLPWLAILVGQVLWVLGDAAAAWITDVEHSTAFPTLADAFYLAGYPFMALALGLLVRGRRPARDLAGLLDSATVTAGLGLLLWVVSARPSFDASRSSWLAGAVSLAYPALDVVLVGGLVRLIMTPGARTASYRLLFAGILLLVAGDTTTSALSLWTSSGSTWSQLLWLGSYVAWGAAALHPSMAALSEPGREDRVTFTRWRLASLAAASVVAPAVLAVQRAAGLRVDVWAAVTGSVTVFGLVVARMGVAIAQIVASQGERERLQLDLAHQATHDPLTDLPNRAQAVELITAALSRSQRGGYQVGLLFVDLDGFKAVNDTLGHSAGDQVLCTVARRFHEQVRAGDVVARLGGDEFVVLLENLDTEADALHLAQRLLDAAAEPIWIPTGACASIGASIGLAIAQDGRTDPDRLLHEADTAAYRAKAGGRGRVEVFDDGLRRELAERAALETALADAIRLDELTVHYQPVISLATGDTLGYEALVRWERPGHGLLNPAQFIPTAELSTLISDLDTWVLRRACRQLAEWNRGADRPRMVAVNISGRHLSAPRIIDDVRNALTATGLPAPHLILEITEAALMDDLPAVDHLGKLRDLGVAISIDDFGTGYTSITRLQQLPIDIIKIDRSFLSATPHATTALLELMLHAAHALNLPAVVEGVEHPHQLDALRALGCQFVQGFQLSHPLPAEEITHTQAPAA